MFFQKKYVVVTHSSHFHPDDVFSAAVFKMLHGSKIIFSRTRDLKEIEKADIVFDVGGIYDPNINRFDHHQEGGAGLRDNGVPFASFGLVWKKYGIILAKNDRVALEIDKSLVQFVDAMDNGVGKLTPVMAEAYAYDIGLTILRFNPTWKEKESYDECFIRAVDFAEKILRRLIVTTTHMIDAESFVVEAYLKAVDKRIIEVPDNIPWQEVLIRFTEPLFVLESRNDGLWSVKSVRKTLKSFDIRKSFPESWAGKSGEDLVRLSGVSDATFCHNKRFIAVAKSRDGALALVKKALEE